MSQLVNLLFKISFSAKLWEKYLGMKCTFFKIKSLSFVNYLTSKTKNYGLRKRI